VQDSSEELGLEPEDDGGQDNHCPIIDGSLLVAGGHAPPLFEPINAALDHIAPRIGRLVKDEWTTRSSGPMGALIAALWNRVFDLPPAEQASTARIAIALVGDDAIWAPPRAPASARSRNADSLQDRLQLGTVMSLSWRDHHRKRASLAVAGQVELGRQPAAAAAEPLVGGVLDPLFTSA
jgi:hypothetical protein